jgi:hypothetical protein
MVDWNTEIVPDTRIYIELIDWFSARGMRRVYGRGDVFLGKGTFNMDIWLNRHGRLLARFWSRCNDVDGRSLEIVGLSPTAIPDRKPNAAFEDSWIPQRLREEYEDWIIAES